MNFGRRDESRLYKVGRYGETMTFIINVYACRDVDLSRLGKRTNPITVDLSRLGVYRNANPPELGNFFPLFVKQTAI